MQANEDIHPMKGERGEVYRGDWIKDEQKREYPAPRFSRTR
jgi:hypothetical protein